MLGCSRYAETENRASTTGTKLLDSMVAVEGERVEMKVTVNALSNVVEQTAMPVWN